MRAVLWRWVRRAIVLAGFIVAAFALRRFPWQATFAALVGADAALLAAALVINLASLLAKGWAWHLLLHPVARCRWRVAQEANLVCAAVNSISVLVMGEAARMHYVARHDGVPPATAAASILGARAVEALGLALFVLGMPFLGSLPPLFRWIQLGAALALVLAAAALLVRSRGRRDPPRFLPRVVRSMLAALLEMGSFRRIAVPTLLAVASWITQWGTYHLVLLAIGVPVTPAASVTALIITNIGGLLRITPANVGVTQAAMTVSLLPFGVPPEQAVAAGLALQGIQVLPVLALAMALVGWKGLRQEAAGSESTPGN
jgi:uncharacterized membrane protein YbhN (UPF0104 family)